jgi:N-acetylmuramoyl-L-alanine amidase
MKGFKLNWLTPFWKQKEPVVMQEENTDYSKYMIFVDAGHGGIDPTTGKYATAPDKMAIHSRPYFHNGKEFYEGVFNRAVALKLLEKLAKLHIPAMPVFHPYLDTRLKHRVDIANFYNAAIQKGIYISLHADYFRDSSVKGFSVFTSKGQTKSDPIADQMYLNMKHFFPDAHFRSQEKEDGDYDFEANFYVVTNTAMPAILNEFDFFSNEQQAIRMMDNDIQDIYVSAIVETIKWAQLNS